jgi:hypothetical protein
MTEVQVLNIGLDMTMENFRVVLFHPELKEIFVRAAVLEINNIPYRIEEIKSFWEATFFYSPFNRTELKVKDIDLPKAIALLNDYYGLVIESINIEDLFVGEFQVDPFFNYFPQESHESGDNEIKEMSEEELIDIVYKKDEWHEDFVMEAEKSLILKDILFNEETKQQLLIKRNTELTLGMKADWRWIIVGYLYSFSGGYFGIMMGYFLAFAKTKDLLNKEYYAHHPETRVKGFIMFIIALLSFGFIMLMSLDWVLGFVNGVIKNHYRSIR